MGDAARAAGKRSRHDASSSDHAGSEAVLDELTARQQNALLHDLYARLQAVDPRGAAKALQDAQSSKKVQQSLNRQLCGKWWIKSEEGRTIGKAEFSLLSGQVKLKHVEINDFDGGDASCDDHHEQLEFNISSRICKQRVEGCFEVWVHAADDVAGDFNVTSGLDEYEDDDLSAADLTLVRQ